MSAVGSDLPRATAWYRELRAQRKCPLCRAGLLPEEPNAYCWECSEKRNRKKRTKKNLRKSRERLRTKYWSDSKAREKRLADNKKRRLDKKLRGECLFCPLRCLPDHNLCEEHRDKNRAAGREWARRNNQKKKGQRDDERFRRQQGHDQEVFDVALDFKDDDVPDILAAFEQLTGMKGATEERIRIAQYVRSLRIDGQSPAGVAQLEAVADAILEGRPNAYGEPRQFGGGTISCGPVSVNLNFCHTMGHTLEQIHRLVELCLTASKLENKITSHRNGMTRTCDRCGQWTFPLPTRCHLCFPKKGSPKT